WRRSVPALPYFSAETRRTMSKVYDRLPTESDAAWHAFQQFRDAGATRTLDGVWRKCKGRDKGRADGTWQEWLRKYRWRERVAAWDAEVDAVRQAAQQTAVAKVAAEHAEKREITAQRVLEETANIAFSRVTDVVKWKGVEGLVDSDALPDHVAAAIEAVEVITDKDGKVRHKVKFHN